jgi:hypothetical protein
MSAHPSGSTTSRRPRRAVVAALIAAAAVGASLVAAPAAVAAPVATITLDADAAATEGDTLTLTVTATDVSDLFAYDLTVEFDEALLAYVDDSATGPAGGFTSAVPAEGSVTVTHTRLGTSPALSTTTASPTLELASITFEALDGGTALLSLPEARLVGAAGDLVSVTTIAPVEVELTALPDPPAPPVDEPDPGTDPDTDPDAAATPLPVTGSGGTRPLASTGADATGWLLGGAFGVALLAAGAVLLVARRRAVTK